MNAKKCFDQYEKMFDETVMIPFELPADKTFGDFVDAIKDCIEKKQRYVPERYGFQINNNIIV